MFQCEVLLITEPCDKIFIVCDDAFCSISSYQNIIQPAWLTGQCHGMTGMVKSTFTFYLITQTFKL
jgi:hypothetical protein